MTPDRERSAAFNALMDQGLSAADADAQIVSLETANPNHWQELSDQSDPVTDYNLTGLAQTLSQTNQANTQAAIDEHALVRGYDPTEFRDLISSPDIGIGLSSFALDMRQGTTWEEYAEKARNRGVIGLLDDENRANARAAQRGLQDATIEQREQMLEQLQTATETGYFDNDMAGMAGAFLPEGLDPELALMEARQRILFSSEEEDQNVLTQEGERGYIAATRWAQGALNDPQFLELVNKHQSAVNGASRFVKDRAEELAGEVLAGDLSSDQYGTLKLQALRELAMLKTVGVWSGPALMPLDQIQDFDVSEPAESGWVSDIKNALKPRVEVVGLTNVGTDGDTARIVVRMQGAPEWVLDMADIPQAFLTGAFRGVWDEEVREELAMNSDDFFDVITNMAHAGVEGIETRANLFEEAMKSDLATVGMDEMSRAETGGDFAVGFAKTAVPTLLGFGAAVLFPDLFGAAAGVLKAPAKLRLLAHTVSGDVAMSDASANLIIALQRLDEGNTEGAVEALREAHRIETGPLNDVTEGLLREQVNTHTEELLEQLRHEGVYKPIATDTETLDAMGEGLFGVPGMIGMGLSPGARAERFRLSNIQTGDDFYDFAQQLEDLIKLRTAAASNKPEEVLEIMRGVQVRTMTKGALDEISETLPNTPENRSLLARLRNSVNDLDMVKAPDVEAWPKEWVKDLKLKQLDAPIRDKIKDSLEELAETRKKLWDKSADIAESTEKGRHIYHAIDDSQEALKATIQMRVAALLSMRQKLRKQGGVESRALSTVLRPVTSKARKWDALSARLESLEEIVEQVKSARKVDDQKRAEGVERAIVSIRNLSVEARVAARQIIESGLVKDRNHALLAALMMDQAARRWAKENNLPVLRWWTDRAPDFVSDPTPPTIKRLVKPALVEWTALKPELQDSFDQAVAKLKGADQNDLVELMLVGQKADTNEPLFGLSIVGEDTIWGDGDGYRSPLAVVTAYIERLQKAKDAKILEKVAAEVRKAETKKAEAETEAPTPTPAPAPTAETTPTPAPAAAPTPATIPVSAEQAKILERLGLNLKVTDALEPAPLPHKPLIERKGKDGGASNKNLPNAVTDADKMPGVSDDAVIAPRVLWSHIFTKGEKTAEVKTNTVVDLLAQSGASEITRWLMGAIKKAEAIPEESRFFARSGKGDASVWGGSPKTLYGRLNRFVRYPDEVSVSKGWHNGWITILTGIKKDLPADDLPTEPQELLDALQRRTKSPDGAGFRVPARNIIGTRKWLLETSKSEKVTTALKKAAGKAYKDTTEVFGSGNLKTQKPLVTALAGYSPGKKQILVYAGTGAHGFNEPTIVHEILHAATYQALRDPKNKAIRGDLKIVRDKVVEALEKAERDGLLSDPLKNLLRELRTSSPEGQIDELITYAFTDSEVQAWLKGVTLKTKALRSITTAFSKILEAISAVLDLKRTDGNITALEAVMDLTGQIITKQPTSNAVVDASSRIIAMSRTSPQGEIDALAQIKRLYEGDPDHAFSVVQALKDEGPEGARIAEAFRRFDPLYTMDDRGRPFKDTFARFIEEDLFDWIEENDYADDIDLTFHARRTREGQAVFEVEITDLRASSSFAKGGDFVPGIDPELTDAGQALQQILPMIRDKLKQLYPGEVNLRETFDDVEHVDNAGVLRLVGRLEPDDEILGATRINLLPGMSDEAKKLLKHASQVEDPDTLTHILTMADHIIVDNPAELRAVKAEALTSAILFDGAKIRSWDARRKLIDPVLLSQDPELLGNMIDVIARRVDADPLDTVFPDLYPDMSYVLREVNKGLHILVSLGIISARAETREASKQLVDKINLLRHDARFESVADDVSFELGTWDPDKIAEKARLHSFIQTDEARTGQAVDPGASIDFTQSTVDAAADVLGLKSLGVHRDETGAVIRHKSKWAEHADPGDPHVPESVYLWFELEVSPEMRQALNQLPQSAAWERRRYDDLDNPVMPLTKVPSLNAINDEYLRQLKADDNFQRLDQGRWTGVLRSIRDSGSPLMVQKISDKEYKLFLQVHARTSVLDHTRGGILFQKGPRGEARSSWRLEDGKSIITALKEPDFTSFIHEMGHLLRRDLNQQQLEQMASWLKTKNIEVEIDDMGRFIGDPSVVENAEETFAKAFEVYMSTRNTDSPWVSRMFQDIQNALGGLLEDINYKAVTPDDAMVQIFDNLVSDHENILKTPTRSASHYFTELTRSLGRTLRGRFTQNDGIAKDSAASYIVREARHDERNLSIYSVNEAGEALEELTTPRQVSRVFENGRNIAFFLKPEETTGLENLTQVTPPPRIGKPQGTDPKDNVFTPDHAERLTRTLTDKLAAGPRESIAVTNIAQAATGDDIVDQMRRNIEGKGVARKIARGVLTTFVGGDPFNVHGLSALPDITRKAILAGTRLVENAYGEASRLIVDASVDKDWAKVYAFLAGDPVTFKKGRQVVSSGYNSMEQAQLSLADWFKTSGLNEQWGVISENFHAGRSATLLDQNALDAIIGKFTDSKVPDFLKRILKSMTDGKPLRETGARINETDLKVLDKIFVHLGVVDDGTGIKPPPTAVKDWTQRTQKLFEDIDAVAGEKGPEMKSRITMLITGFGNLQRAVDTWSGLGLMQSADAVKSFTRYLDAEPLTPAEMTQASRLSSLFGLNKEFVEADGLFRSFEGYSIPEAAKGKLDEALARGEITAGKWGIQATTDELPGYASMFIRYMKKRMTRGAYVVRQRYFLMNTIDHFFQMAGTPGVGFRTATASTARMMLQNIMAFPGMELVTLLHKDPEKIRETLQKGGDRLAHNIGSFLSQSKWRVDVNDVLKGGDGHVTIAGNVYTHKQLRQMAIEEGIFSSFDQSELSSAIGNMLDEYRHLIENTSGVPSSVANLAKDGHRVLSQNIDDIAEAWGERERLGAMITLMERGVPPRRAARLTIDALYDYAGTMSRGDRHFIVSLFLPFWAFQKNANQQFIRRAFSPEGAYRMGVLRRGAEYGSQALETLWFGATYDPYGVDVRSMPPDLRDRYMYFRKTIEHGYGPIRGNLPPLMLNPLLEALGVSSIEELDEKLADGENEELARKLYIIENGYGGIENVPKSVIQGIRMALTRPGGGAGTLYFEEGEAYLHGSGLGGISPALQTLSDGSDGPPVSDFLGPLVDPAGRAGFRRHRVGVAVPPRMSEALRAHLRITKRVNQDDLPYAEFLLPESAIYSGLNHAAYLAATYANLFSSIYSISPLADEARPAVDIQELMKNSFNEVIDVNRAPIPSLAASTLGFGPEEGRIPRRLSPSLVPIVESAFPGLDLIKTTEINALMDAGVNEAQREAFIQDFASQMGLEVSEARDILLAKDRRYYMPPGTWSFVMENTPLFGELNRRMLDLEPLTGGTRDPLDASMGRMGRIMEIARLTTGVETARVYRHRQARQEDPRFPVTSVEPSLD